MKVRFCCTMNDSFFDMFQGRLWDVHSQILRVSDLQCRPSQYFPSCHALVSVEARCAVVAGILEPVIN